MTLATAAAPQVTALLDRVLFGAAYYHEYQPYERLHADLDLMADAHFSVIRVGESVWSTWEPENGRFALDWLQPVLDGAHARGISVILGTPTYAVPPWLVRLYPEIAGERRTAERIPWGARQEVDFSHPAFRFHAERVIRRIVARYADHPAIIGFQVDNEPGLELLHNHGLFQRFVDDLRHTYGDVDTLNREWGLVYWSHQLSTWADLWTPDGNVQPQYDVAWRRFQAQQTTDFIEWQAAIVREYARPNQFITTCVDYARPAVDDDALTEQLDVTAGNLYFATQDALALPDRSAIVHEWKSTGTWSLYMRADRIYSSRQEPFLVTETNATRVGASWDNRPPYDGQLRQAAWALVSRGARMIEYWHWHTLHFGTETDWGGVLPHSGRPGRTYREVARIGAEFEAAGQLLAGITPHADITMVYSMPAKWLMQKYPALARSDGGPDENAYHGVFDPFYRGAFDARLQVRIVHARQLVDRTSPHEAASQRRVLVVPGLYLAADQTLDWLRAYAEAGGHLILGPRTAYGDDEGRARTDVMPARLAEAAGVWYEEFSNLGGDITVTAADPTVRVDASAAATRWIDGLTVDGASVLARYAHPHFGQWPAVTTRQVGDGRITCVGTVPDRSLAKALMGWAGGSRDRGWHDLPESVTATRGTARDGSIVHFVHNWSWRPVGVQSSTAMRDALGSGHFAAGDDIALGAWDVRVLVESNAAAPDRMHVGAREET